MGTLPQWNMTMTNHIDLYFIMINILGQKTFSIFSVGHDHDHPQKLPIFYEKIETLLLAK